MDKISIESVDKNLLSKFVNHVLTNKQEDPTLEKCILVKTLPSYDDEEPPMFGILYISSFGEELDNHCKQCQNESPLFFRLAEFDGFPKYISAEIGNTKYQKILNSEIECENIELLFDLLKVDI